MDRFEIEPGGAQTLTNETDEAAHAHFAEFYRESRGKTRQRVQEMSQAHQVVVRPLTSPLLPFVAQSSNDRIGRTAVGWLVQVNGRYKISKLP